MNRVKEKYQKDVVPALTKEFGYKNVMAVPRVQKVVVNMGLGEATANAKLVDIGSDELILNPALDDIQEVARLAETVL